MEEYTIQIELKGHNLEQLLACFKDLQQQNEDFTVKLVKYQSEKENNIEQEGLTNNIQNIFTQQEYRLGRKGEEVLKLLADGYTYNDIADTTGIGINGVRYYIKKAFKALNVNNGRDAVRIYLTHFKKAN